MLNKVLIAGRLTREPEIEYLPNGMQIVNLPIAVNRKFKDKNEN